MDRIYDEVVRGNAGAFFISWVSSCIFKARSWMYRAAIHSVNQNEENPLHAHQSHTPIASVLLNSHTPSDNSCVSSNQTLNPPHHHIPTSRFPIFQTPN